MARLRTISCYRTFPAFLECFPDIEIYMSEGDRLVDLVREGIDCVLRVGTPQESDMVARTGRHA